MKLCPRCELVKPETAFGNREMRKQSFCRECNKVYQRAWYKLAKASGKRGMKATEAYRNGNQNPVG